MPEFTPGCLLHFDFGEEEMNSDVKFGTVKDSFGGRAGGVGFVDYRQVRNMGQRGRAQRGTVRHGMTCDSLAERSMARASVAQREGMRWGRSGGTAKDSMVVWRRLCWYSLAVHVKQTLTPTVTAL